MKETEIRGMVADVKEGKLSRRDFVNRMLAVGVTAPMSWHILDFHGVAQAQSLPRYTPTKAGGGGPLKILLWQAPTLLNPHFAIGTKDQEASRVFYEPLAGWDTDGNLVPILAAEIPSREKGTVSADGLSVTWKLKAGVKWHDGKPLTADDLIFTWQYAGDPATAATTIGTYQNIKVEKVDDLTVKITFPQPTPFWADAYVGAAGMVLPKHVFEQFKGAASRDAPANLKPVGTGPYKFVDFKPGDMLRGERNTEYHIANQPFFDTLEVKGGGDAVSAARAVIQTGEFDYAWNMQVEDEILLRMERGGRGKAIPVASGNIEFIMLNVTDPWTEVDGERSSVKTKHPTLTDPAVRQAINLLIDRDSVEKFIYGRGGKATANFVNAPAKFTSPNMKYEFNVDKANKILDDAGWVRGSDGIRAKDGKKLKFVYQTSINAPRQKTQAIIKQAAQRAGIDLELKSVTASVFFSSDVANPDTYSKFYCDMQMYTTTMLQPDPERFLLQLVSWEIANKENKWQGRNITRFTSKEADDAFKEAQNSLDPARRAALFIRMNDIFCSENILLPVLARTRMAASSNRLTPTLSGWDLDLWLLNAWFRPS
ncbi:peptide ABC transporter substrate-binding protein [Phreatobacter oligotrophus]|jgi:peptide/nickel transport system substrate-binding protein|uniref:Peptide/nickel transport system substrate-binding protein n=1 Tax=Phreatobacter oligotrophus TaxID=1122261 RepID=A0A2T4Z2Z8_9HYPH|nr:peptide ABC transporter substrate-binding protein [Phreatobacter oligotrophus]PTM55156.1 peptide/nickel transport system substrate-binding protein [Phreatobacter oligotrophus]